MPGSLALATAAATFALVAEEEHVRADHEPVGRAVLESAQRCVQFRRVARIDCDDLHAERFACLARFLQRRPPAAVTARVAEQDDPPNVRRNLLQQLQPLRDQLSRQRRHASGIAARVRQAFREPRADRIARYKDHRYRRRRRQCSASSRRGQRHDQIHFGAHEVLGRGPQVIARFSPSPLDDQVPAFDVAELGQPLPPTFLLRRQLPEASAPRCAPRLAPGLHVRAAAVWLAGACGSRESSDRLDCRDPDAWDARQRIDIGRRRKQGGSDDAARRRVTVANISASDLRGRSRRAAQQFTGREPGLLGSFASRLPPLRRRQDDVSLGCIHGMPFGWSC